MHKLLVPGCYKGRLATRSLETRRGDRVGGRTKAAKEKRLEPRPGRPGSCRVDGWGALKPPEEVPWAIL